MSLSVYLRLHVGSFDLETDFESDTGMTALFGPSGAGKTLTLRSIAGLVTPQAGRVVLGDRVVLDTARGIDLPPRERGIGYVFQQYALFPHLSVEQNVAFGIHSLEREARDARVAELLEMVGLRGLEKRRPNQLSGGQQQRVALARALAPQPELILLDEPFAAVDLRVRRRLREELRRIHEVTRTPMLLVTHDLHEVRELSDFLVVLDNGRVLARGDTEHVLTAPTDPEILELLGG